MNESLLNLFCSYHPEFLNCLDIFSEIDKKRILKNLKSGQDRNNFLSIVAEIRFGELFSKLNLEIEYEKKYSNKQIPDWSLIYKDTVAICEVYRLGKSEKDQMVSDFENHIKEPLEKLQYDYFIKIHFVEENFNVLITDTATIIKEFEEWIKNLPKIVGDRVTISNIFEFEVIKTNTNINHLCFIGPANSINQKSHKLKQVEHLSDNEITKKLKKYNEIILKDDLPYFICVSVDFLSGFNLDDFKEYFFGMGVKNIDYGTPVNDLDEFKHWGSTWTELGEFYNNPQLSGLVILYNNAFSILINPNQNQVIHHDKNYLLKEKLLSINQ